VGFQATTVAPNSWYPESSTIALKQTPQVLPGIFVEMNGRRNEYLTE
jgi:hypothetical protein